MNLNFFSWKGQIDHKICDCHYPMSKLFSNAHRGSCVSCWRRYKEAHLWK